MRARWIRQKWCCRSASGRAGGRGRPSRLRAVARARLRGASRVGAALERVRVARVRVGPRHARCGDAPRDRRLLHSLGRQSAGPGRRAARGPGRHPCDGSGDHGSAGVAALGDFDSCRWWNGRRGAGADVDHAPQEHGDNRRGREPILQPSSCSARWPRQSSLWRFRSWPSSSSSVSCCCFAVSLAGLFRRTRVVRTP